MTHRISITFATLLVSLLTACANQPVNNAGVLLPPSSAGGQCNAAGAQFAAGRRADAGLVEQARQGAGALMARVLVPGQAVTMEFNAQRLNLDVDGTNTVTRVRCG